MKNLLINFAPVIAVALLFAGCSSAGTYINDPIQYDKASGLTNSAYAFSNTEEQDGKEGPLSQFSTQFNVDNPGRANNIKTASVAIDGKIIQPGATFSFNEAVGPTTQKNGYMLATVFDKGKEKKGYGGGVCQVSSTLFNAADYAGLEITERHPHSKEVHYVEKGRDAATSYGSSDLKFVNTLSYPVKINSYIANDTLTIEMLKA